NVTEGQFVRVCGFDLQVAGIFDGGEFDQKAIMLSGEPLSPLKYVRDALDAGGRKLSDSNLDTLELDADGSAAELGGSYDHLSASEFIIVPASLARYLPNPSLRSIGMRFEIDRANLQTLDLADLRQLGHQEGIADADTMDKAALIAQLVALNKSG